MISDRTLTELLQRERHAQLCRLVVEAVEQRDYWARRVAAQEHRISLIIERVEVAELGGAARMLLRLNLAATSARLATCLEQRDAWQLFLIDRCQRREQLEADMALMFGDNSASQPQGVIDAQEPK